MQTREVAAYNAVIAAMAALARATADNLAVREPPARVAPVIDALDGVALLLPLPVAAE